jgi:hypothetical protein
MAKQPEDMVLPLLRQIQVTQAEHGRDLASIKADLRRQGVKIDELMESSAMALGLAGHANIRHNTVAQELEALKSRIERLEEKLDT